ncbi:MAG TPA: hypothetical protein VNO30_03605 [Kofleriaceae bacterium]|nr:hypothetical protein [Kofleriaceae bacterium]
MHHDSDVSSISTAHAANAAPTRRAVDHHVPDSLLGGTVGAAQRARRDPLFVSITERADAEGGAAALAAATLQVKPGDTLPIAGRSYTVEPLRRADGSFPIKNRHDDLRGNLNAFELLRRTGALPADVALDDLYLRGTSNGDCVLELRHDGPAPDTAAPLQQPGQRHIFVRFDAGLQNPHLGDADFDEIVVRSSPCMFGTQSALFMAASGRALSMVERSTAIDEPIEQILTREGPSLYEREILRRLSATLALLARGGKIDRFVAAFPRGAYYGFPIAGAARGYVSPRLMLEWFDRVDERVAMLRARYVTELARVCPALAVEQYSFMDSACDMLRELFQGRLARGAEPFDGEALLARVIETMEARDPFAKLVFASGVRKPATFRELADLTYAATNLAEMADESPKKRLVIGLYDPTENIMWNETRKLRYRSLLEPRGLYRPVGPTRSQLDSLSYVGVMPLEQVVIDVSSDYAARHFSGTGRLVALPDSLLPKPDSHLVSGVFGIPADALE